MTAKFKKQYQEGDTVWCKLSNGEIHSGSLLGIFFDEKDIYNHLYVVAINDENKDFVSSPIKKSFIEYFKEIYSKEEIRIIRGNNEDIQSN